MKPDIFSMTTTPSFKDRSREFENHELFFSTTNEKGIITGCNDIFLRVASYPPSQILTKPHNVIRHPDMPRTVFKLLWDYLLAGRTIGAYVKNLAATGEYYWVYALACPIPGGFLSIRFKPTSPIFSAVKPLYAEMLEIESQYSRKNRGQGISFAEEHLRGALKTLGFCDYDSFMQESLRLEIATIAPLLLNRQLTELSQKSDSDVSTKLRELKALERMLIQKSTHLRKFVKTLHNLSANASVRARHVGNQGGALGVIGEEISRATKSLRAEITGFERLVAELTFALNDAAFKHSMAFLQGQMADKFRTESQEAKLTVEEQVQTFGKPLSVLSEILEDCKKHSTNCAAITFANLMRGMSDFNNFIDFLDKLIQTLQFGYVTGQAEVASIPDDKGFSLLLNELNESSDVARNELYELRTSVQTMADAGTRTS